MLKRGLIWLMLLILALMSVNSVFAVQKTVDDKTISCPECLNYGKSWVCRNSCLVTITSPNHLQKLFLFGSRIYFHEKGISHISLTKSLPRGRVVNINGVLISNLLKEDKIYFLQEFPFYEETIILKVVTKGKSIELCGSKFLGLYHSRKDYSEFMIFRNYADTYGQCKVFQYKIYTKKQYGRKVNKYLCGNMSLEGSAIKALQCEINSENATLTCDKCKFDNLKINDKLVLEFTPESNFKRAIMHNDKVNYMQVFADKVKVFNTFITLNKSKVFSSKESIPRNAFSVAKEYIAMHSGWLNVENERFTYVFERPNFLFHGYFIVFDKNRKRAKGIVPWSRIHTGKVSGLKSRKIIVVEGMNHKLLGLQTMAYNIKFHLKKITLKPIKAAANYVKFSEIIKGQFKLSQGDATSALVLDPKKGKQRLQNILRFSKVSKPSKIPETSTTGVKLVAAAKTFVGYPYILGGTGLSSKAPTAKKCAECLKDYCQKICLERGPNACVSCMGKRGKMVRTKCAKYCKRSSCRTDCRITKGDTSCKNGESCYFGGYDCASFIRASTLKAFGFDTYQGVMNVYASCGRLHNKEDVFPKSISSRIIQGQQHLSKLYDCNYTPIRKTSDFNKLRPGDFVYWTNKKAGIKRYGNKPCIGSPHIGMYVGKENGKHTLIQAASQRGAVLKTRMVGGRSTFCGATRIFERPGGGIA